LPTNHKPPFLGRHRAAFYACGPHRRRVRPPANKPKWRVRPLCGPHPERVRPPLFGPKNVSGDGHRVFKTGVAAKRLDLPACVAANGFGIVGSVEKNYDSE